MPKKMGLPVLRPQKTSPCVLVSRIGAFAHLASREAGKETPGPPVSGAERTGLATRAYFDLSPALSVAEVMGSGP